MLDQYDLELEKVAQEIKNSNAKKVCIQLPDGLKPFAVKIVTELKSKTSSDIFIWSGSNFGACDTPFYLDKYEFDLLINFGHTTFKR